MKTMKKILAVAIAAAMVLAFTACGKETKTSKLEEIQEKGVLTVATDAAWAPFEYIGENGEPTGSDLEIAQYIADQLGVELEVINVAFDSLSTYVANNETDLVLAAMTITEERKEQLAFSDPYTVACQYIVVPEGENGVKTIEDLAGKHIGTHLGTTGDLLVSDEINDGVLTDTEASNSQYKALPDAALDMKNGKIDAIVADTLMAKNLCAANEGLKCFELVYADGSNTQEEYGIGMAKGDEEFTAKINEIIAPIVEDGTIDGWIIKHTELAAEMK